MSIKGNTVGTTMPRSDWAQTDPKKADYIKNKPDLSGIEAAQKAADNAAAAAENAATAAGNAQNTADTAKNTAEAALPKSGGTMTGAVDMGGKNITSLGTPSNSGDAATKGYVDGKRLSGTVTLTTSGWSSKAQTVNVSGILATDMPHWGIVYGDSAEAEKEAFALIDVLETSAGKFTFRCFGDVPTVALTIQWEVNR